MCFIKMGLSALAIKIDAEMKKMQRGIDVQLLHPKVAEELNVTSGMVTFKALAHIMAEKSLLIEISEQKMQESLQERLSGIENCNNLSQIDYELHSRNYRN